MSRNPFTYQQLDDVLHHLGFSRERLEPKWLRYFHAPSQTEIILVEKKPADPVRSSDAWSAREHLLQKGLIGEEELDRLMEKPPTRSPASTTHK
jgi:hypothetical protein